MVFSWIEFFWPSSADRRRRNQVVREVEHIKNTLANNFSSANKLSEFLNTQIPNANLSYISVEPSKSLAENGRTLSSQTQAINALLNNVDRKMKVQLEPQLYEKIINSESAFEDRIEAAREMSKATVDISSDTVIGVVGKLVSKNVIKILTSRTAQFAASPLAVAILTESSETTADALIDAIKDSGETGNVDDGIMELRVLGETYTADSTEFTDTIHEVLADVTIWNKYH